MTAETLGPEGAPSDFSFEAPSAFSSLFNASEALGAAEASALLQFELPARIEEGAGLAEVECPLAVKDPLELDKLDAAIASFHLH